MLFLPFVGLGLVVSTATFYGMIRQRQYRTAVLATQSTEAAGARVQDQIADRLQEVEQVVAIEKSFLRNGCCGPDGDLTADLGAVQRLFRECLTLFDQVDDLAVANDRGDFLHLSRLPNGNFSLRRRQLLPDRRFYRYEGDGETFGLKETRTDFDLLRDPPADPWYRAVQQNGALWRAVVSRAKGRSQPHLRLVRFMPLANRAGRWQGVVSVGLNLQRLRTDLLNHRPSPGSRLLAIDAKGQLVATTGAESVATVLAADNVARQRLARDSDDPLVAAAAAQVQGEVGPHTQRWQWQGKPYVLHVRPLPQTWQLVVVTPQSDFDDLEAAWQWKLWRSGWLFLGMAAVGWGLARYLSQVLQRIEHALQGLAQDPFAVVLPPTPIAEFQNLSDRLQVVAQDLAAAATLQQNYTAELEGAIAERIQALQAAERFWADLVNHLPAAVRIEDAHTLTLHFANAAHGQLADVKALACSPTEVETLRAGFTLEAETRLFDREGQARWWWVRRMRLGDSAFLLTIAEDITVRRQLEVARQDREAQFRNLAENVPAAIFRYVLHSDGQDGITYISPRIFHLCEVPPSNILNDLGCLWRLLPESEVSALKAAIAYSAAYLTPLHQELPVLLPSGKSKWMEMVALPLLGHHGEVFWDGLLTDITERRRSAQALRTSEERYRTLAESLPVGVFRSDAQGQTLYTNQTLQRIVGVTAADLTADRWMQFVDERDREAEIAGWQTFVQEVQGGRTAPRETEYRYRGAAGQTGWVWVRVTPECDRQGQLLGFLGSVQDITARQVLAEGLDRELAFRRAIEAVMVEGVAVADLQGRQTYVSPALCRMVGWSAEELVGQMPPYPYWPPEAAAHIQQVLEGHIFHGISPPEGVELIFRRRGGQRFEVLMWSAPVYNDQGQVEAWMASFYDLTARKALEREAARDRYRLLFESIHEGFAVIEVLFDDQNQPVDVYFWEANAAFCAFVGQPELAGRRGSAWAPPAAAEDRDWLLLYAQVLQTGERVRVEGEVKFLGQWFESHIFPVGALPKTKLAS
ncbi:MAG: PAS domain S-box protein [Oscillatoriales cyanobacterium SM2_1_8]|nr:PAS domain S-box protein [Oscillatoriales cyanobacterium SM2_1_8]